MTGERSAAFARSLVRFAHRRPRPVLAVAALVLAVGVGLAFTLTFDTDVMALVPKDDPAVNDFKRVLEEFGSLDTLLLVVPIGSEEEVDEALALVDRLEVELSASPHLTHVQAHLQDPARMAAAVLRHAVLYLDAQGREALERQLTDEGLAARAADIRAGLDSPHSMVAEELSSRDPLGLLPLLLGRVSRTPSLRLDVASGYYLAADHSMVLVLAKPTGPAQDIDFDQALFADVRPRLDRARAAVAEDLGIEPEAVPEVEVGGGYRIALEDASLIRSDIAVNSVTSLLGVMVLFFFAYRRLAAALYAFVPLAVGLATTFGFAAITLGHLSSVTAGFAALLVGLGIDFSIVMYGRYLEERLKGAPIGEALEAMGFLSGPAVILGAVTTVGTFYAFLVTRFQGLREFGLLTGSGIVLMALSTFLLLPALITLLDRNRTPTPHPAALDMSRMIAFAGRHRRVVLGLTAVLLVAAVAGLRSIEFEDDVRNLRSPSNRGVQIQEQVSKAFGLSFNTMMIRIEAADLPQLLDRLHAVDEGLDRLVEAGTISSYESLAHLLPPGDQQRAALAWLREHQELTDPKRARAVLEQAMREQGLRPDAFAEGFETLEQTLRPAGEISLDAWQGTPIQELVDRSLRIGDGRVATVVNVLTPAGIWRRHAPPDLVTLVEGVDGATLTGVNLISERLRGIVWQDAALAGALGFLVVLALLWWELRTPTRALLCLVPVAIGVAWTLGVMALLGLRLNFMNVFVTTMIIGVGSDYGIHILHRLREGGDWTRVGETGRAVLLAAITTVVGFGSLVTTHYPGLQSIGWMTSLGVLFAAVAAIVVLPLLARR